MKKFMAEFREFIAQGNVMDLAVGVIIGGAFTGIVTSLCTDIINPLITLISGGNTDVSGVFIPGTKIDVGSFITAIINFLITALVIFCLVKAMNKFSETAKKLAKAKKEEEEAAAPTCPYCLEEVHEGATKCCHCGSDLPAAE